MTKSRKGVSPIIMTLFLIVIAIMGVVGVDLVMLRVISDTSSPSHTTSSVSTHRLSIAGCNTPHILNGDVAPLMGDLAEWNRLDPGQPIFT